MVREELSGEMLALIPSVRDVYKNWGYQRIYPNIDRISNQEAMTPEKGLVLCKIVRKAADTQVVVMSGRAGRPRKGLGAVFPAPTPMNTVGKAALSVFGSA